MYKRFGVMTKDAGYTVNGKIAALKCSTSINNMGMPDCVSDNSKRLRELRKLYKVANVFQEKLTILAEIKEVEAKIKECEDVIKNEIKGGDGSYTSIKYDLGIPVIAHSHTMFEKITDTVGDAVNKVVKGNLQKDRYNKDEKEVKYKVYPLIFGLSLCIPINGGKWKLKQKNNDKIRQQRSKRNKGVYL